MKLELSKYKVIHLNGEQFGSETVATQLAQYLATLRAEESTAPKLFLLAMNLYKDGELNIDSADYDLLINTVKKNTGGMSVLVHEQIKQALEREKDKHRESKK